MAWSGKHFLKQPVPKEVDKILPVTSQNPIGVGSAVADHKGRVWIALGSRGQFYVEDGKWHSVVVRKNHPDWAANAAFADLEDHIWLANDAYLAVHKDGITKTYDGKDGPGVGPIKVIQGLRHYVLIGGELGLAIFSQGRFHSVLTADGNDFGLVTSIVVTEKDGVWLAASPGIVHINTEEIIRAAEQPGYRAKSDVLDLTSDLPEPIQSEPLSSGAIQGNDRKLCS